MLTYSLTEDYKFTQKHKNVVRMSSAKCFKSNNGNSIRLLYNTAYNEPMPRCITNLRVRARYIGRGKSQGCRMGIAVGLRRGNVTFPATGVREHRSR